MTIPIVIKHKAKNLSVEGCGWCGTPYRQTVGNRYLFRFGVVTQRGIAWDEDNQFCSKWCFMDYHDEVCFIDWVCMNGK